MSKLALEDIADLRAYERERDEFRTHVIALKKRRRVSVGPVATLLFENRDTIRFQIQEMARAEKLLTDEAIQLELDVYNPLIPEPGHLCATLFLELTSDAQLREWLPKLVGIETSVQVVLGDGAGATDVVRCEVDPDHAQQLTRDEITASVHYVTFSFTPDQVERFTAAGGRLGFDHPSYAFATDLGPDTVAELTTDLRGV